MPYQATSLADHNAHEIRGASTWIAAALVRFVRYGVIANSPW
jgi:hypothetical protein